MHDFADAHLASNCSGKHERVEGKRQLVVFGKFVSELKAIWDELDRPAPSYGRHPFHSMWARFQPVRLQAHIDCETPCRFLGIVKNGRSHRAIALRKRLKQLFEPVLEMGLVLKASPLRVG